VPERPREAPRSTKGEFSFERRDEAKPKVVVPVEVELEIEGKELGRYLVLREHIAVGQAKIYRALDTVLGRCVGLRVIPKRKSPTVKAKTQSGSTTTQGLRDILALAKVSHPHLVPIFDAGISGNYIYWAMELVPGRSLREYLQVAKPSGATIIDLLIPIAGALATLNAAGYFYGAIDFDHIFVSDDHRAYLWTSGPNNRRDNEQAPDVFQDATDPNGFVRTWIAPEIRNGGLPNDRTDVYAFCAMLMQALFGTTPTFYADASHESHAVIPRRIRGQRVPSELVTVLQRGLSLNVFERFSDVRELKRALQSIAWTSEARLVTQISFVAVPLLGLLALAPLYGSDSSTCETEPSYARGDAFGQLEDRLRLDIGTSGSPRRNSAIAQVMSILAARTQSWSSLRADTCALVHDSSKDRLRDQRNICLQQRESELAQIVSNLAQRKRAALESSITALNGLPPIESCADPSMLEDFEPELSPEQAKIAKDALDYENRAREAMLGNEPEKGAEQLEKALALASSAGLHKVESRVENELSNFARRRANAARTLYFARRAVVRGTAFDDERRIARAQDNLAYSEGYLSHDIERMAERMAASRAIRERYYDRTGSRIRATSEAAIYAWVAFGAEFALPLFSQIYDETNSGKRNASKAELITAGSNFAQALAGAGRFSEALGMHQASLAHVRANYGLTHENVSTQARAVVSIAANLGRLPVIEQTVESSLRPIESEFGDLLASASSRPEFTILAAEHLRYTGRMRAHHDLLERLHSNESLLRKQPQLNRLLQIELAHDAVLYGNLLRAREIFDWALESAAKVGDGEAFDLEDILRSAAIAVTLLQRHAAISAERMQQFNSTWNGVKRINGAPLEIALSQADRAELDWAQGKKSAALAAMHAAYKVVEDYDLWGFGDASNLRMRYAKMLCANDQCDDAYAIARDTESAVEHILGPENGSLIALELELAELSAARCTGDDTQEHLERALRMARAQGLAPAFYENATAVRKHAQTCRVNLANAATNAAKRARPSVHKEATEPSSL
jgi:hypothetical protein